MTGIDLRLDGDRAAEDLIEPGNQVHDVNGFRLAVLERGMTSGRPSVGVIVKLDSGDVVVIQTSLRALYAAVAAIRARYGNLDEGDN